MVIPLIDALGDRVSVGVFRHGMGGVGEEQVVQGGAEGDKRVKGIVKEKITPPFFKSHNDDE